MAINKLYIFEKPDAAKHFVKALGWRSPNRTKHYIQEGSIAVTWCLGHLLQQAPPHFYDEKFKGNWDYNLLPILPKHNEWKMIYNEKDQGRTAQLFAIRDLLKKSESVVIATDNDREGETIGWEVIEFFNYKGKLYRMLYGELTKSVLTKANDNLQDGEKFRSRYEAGLGRMRADWLMGLNLTRGYTSVNNGKLPMGDVFNTGRVISPIVYLLVLREKERQNFKPEDYFSFKGIFEKDKNEYEGEIVFDESILEDKKLKNKEKAKQIYQNLIEEKTATITQNETINKNDHQPLGYSLTELQKEASTKFNFSPQQTLDIAQSLYEKYKLISYPRSDCSFVGEVQQKDAKFIIPCIYSNIEGNSGYDKYNNVKNKIDIKQKTKIWNSKKVGAHHAIIPTGEEKNVSGLSQQEKDLYDIICRRYIMQFLPLHNYDSTEILTQTDKHKFIFKTSGKIILENGWKDIELKKSDNKQTKQELPMVKKGDPVNIKNIEKVDKKTKPPEQYTYSTLLSDMNNIDKFIQNEKLKKIIKSKGIGTEATRAPHIQGLLDKNYAVEKKKKLIPTDKAFAFDSLAANEIKQPEVSAYWEEELELVEKGERTLESFLDKQEKIITRLVNKIKEGKNTLSQNVKGKGKDYPCDECGSLTSRFKAKKSGKIYWRCLSKDCNSLYEDNRGKRGDKIEIVKQPEGDFPCPVCSSQMKRTKSKKTKQYIWFCTDKNCKTFCKDDNGKLGEKIEKATSDHKCPNCDKGRLVKRKGKNGDFWGCNNYPDCKTSVPDNNGKPDYNAPKKEKQTSNYSCPNCEKGKLVKRKGKNGDFWGCNNYPECKTSVPDNNGKPKTE
tara:strand:- start:130995 stop:133505 length:2511 start_codon:yes stop_codon:yes gene_type:complete